MASSAGSISSAPSMPRSRRSVSSSETSGMPRSRARASVRSEVGTAVKMSPPATRRPNSRVTASAVEPVPRPTIMPGATRSAAATASRCRRSASSTLALSMKELRPGIFVNEPVESAVRQGGSDQLCRESRRKLRALENLLERVGFSWPTDEKEDLAARIEHRRGERQASSVHSWHVVGNGQLAVGDKGAGVRKQRCRMPVLSHTEQHQVEPRNATGLGEYFAQQGFVGGGCVPRGFRCRVPGMDVARRDRHEIEEPAPGLARVAFRRPEGNPALVAPKDMDPTPGNPRAIRFARQDGTHLFRGGTAGECDEGRPALSERLLDRVREVFGCCLSQRRPVGNDDYLPAWSEIESQAATRAPHIRFGQERGLGLDEGGRGRRRRRSYGLLVLVLPSSCRFAVSHHRGLSPVKPSGAMSAANASAASKTASRPNTCNSSPRRSASEGRGATTVRTILGISGLSLVVEISLPSSRSTVKNPALPPSAASRTSSKVEAASGLAVGRSVSVTSRCLPAVPARSVARQTLGSPRTGSSSPGVRQFKREPSQPAKRSAPVNPDQRLEE